MLAPAVAALVMLGIAWNMNGQMIAVHKEHETKTSKTKSLEADQARLVLLKGKEQQLRQELSQFASRESGSVAYGEVLREISRLMPSNVMLKILTLQPKARPVKEEPLDPGEKQLLLAGFALGHDLQCLTALAQIIEHLEKSPYFRNAKLISAEETKFRHQAGVDFEIVCSIASGAEGTFKP
jgi:Tfp pilus assembly protein PilN